MHATGRGFVRDMLDGDTLALYTGVFIVLFVRYDDGGLEIIKVRRR